MVAIASKKGYTVIHPLNPLRTPGMPSPLRLRHHIPSSHKGTTLTGARQVALTLFAVMVIAANHFSVCHLHASAVNRLCRIHGEIFILTSHPKNARNPERSKQQADRLAGTQNNDKSREIKQNNHAYSAAYCRKQEIRAKLVRFLQRRHPPRRL